MSFSSLARCTSLAERGVRLPRNSGPSSSSNSSSGFFFFSRFIAKDSGNSNLRRENGKVNYLG